MLYRKTLSEIYGEIMRDGVSESNSALFYAPSIMLNSIAWRLMEEGKRRLRVTRASSLELLFLRSWSSSLLLRYGPWKRDASSLGRSRWSVHKCKRLGT